VQGQKCPERHENWQKWTSNNPYKTYEIRLSIAIFVVPVEGGGMPKTGTQEEMYYKNVSDRPEKNYTLYNVHRTNIIAYLDLQKSQRFMQNRKIPV
jgi:hypothetical protein